MTVTGEANLADVLADFGGNPQRAAGVASYLGFEPIPDPEDRLSGALSGGLKQFIQGRSDDGFGVRELYRVGRTDADPAEAGLWIGVLSDWGQRSSDRDRSRRRVARALVEHVPDRRALAFLVPPVSDTRREAELVFPRTQIGASNGAVTSVRALVDLQDPTRFHRDLLRGLRISPGGSLLDISRTWQREFSVERVTTRFYQEYASVRDRMAEALVSHNPAHPVVKSLSEDEARAWATRQMGRVLFLWFLQAKQWLGEPAGSGSPTYLLDLWPRRFETDQREYFRGILSPLFFDALATGSSNRGEHRVLGFVPYLNGGLFRRNAQEDMINDHGEVSLPDEVFDPESEDSLLNLLSRYRFTTRESTPDDQSVDPDPELLGRVFENLYQGDERHDSGTYYTPREIVHFMCREALDGYLRDETGVSQRTLDTLRLEATGSRDEAQPVPGVPAAKLVDALETVRVCDPAVGSGAFLLGAIQEIVTLRRGILFSEQPDVEHHELYQKVSDWKRRTIENSLHGVDVNPEAVEICRLRLWLSMVLDMDEPPPPDSSWALPNLDFQIVAGDSLVDRLADISFKESWPPPPMQLGLVLLRELQQLEGNIAQRKREFEATHRDPKRLRELRDLIARDQQQIIRLHLADALEKAEVELAQLQKKRPPAKSALKNAMRLVERTRSLLEGVESTDFALVQRPFLWPVAFPEVLRAGEPSAGFDIVLANPPYVRQEKLDSDDQLAYGDTFPEVHTGTADLLTYFYARALQVLKDGGWLAFITSNKFMRAGYGANVREHLPTSLRINRVIDFSDLPLFEANGKSIAAYPAVLVGSRSDDVFEHELRVADLTVPVRKELARAELKVTTENVRGVLEDLDGLLARSENTNYPQALLRRQGWVLQDPTLVRLFERLMSQGTPLGEFVQGRFYYGIKSGLNDAFVIDQDKRDELIGEDPRSEELIKPWLRGQDIKRWRPDWQERYVIAIQSSGDEDADHPWTNAKDEERARSMFRISYPAIHDHLSYFERYVDSKGKTRSLRERKDQGRFWWELRACTYYQEFDQPKMIFRRFANAPAFAFDHSGAYHNDACYFAVSPSPSLTALVNSSVGWYLLSQLCTPLQNGYIQLFVQFLEQLPVPALPPDVERLLSQHVEALARGVRDAHLEQDIDTLAFDVYGLSSMERRLVLDWLGERREAYGAQMPADWRKLNALQASAGAWKVGVDGEQLKRDIRASREIRTRPVPQL